MSLHRILSEPASWIKVQGTDWKSIVSEVCILEGTMKVESSQVLGTVSCQDTSSAPPRPTLISDTVHQPLNRHSPARKYFPPN